MWLRSERTLDSVTATIQATYDDLAPPVAALSGVRKPDLDRQPLVYGTCTKQLSAATARCRHRNVPACGATCSPRSTSPHYRAGPDRREHRPRAIDNSAAPKSGCDFLPVSLRFQEH